jgi:serine/threonine-protein kinase
VSLEETIPIVRQVCRALATAHARGIIHRDVKPENVFLLGGEAGVKVLDFGISKIGEDGSNLTKTGMVMGTPDYMAPEQARGDRVDARADVYAVGAILYRALTGRKPFEGLDQMATLTAALVQEPPRPSSLNAEIPIGLELVVQRAMAKEPSERFQTMQELEDALGGFNAPSLPPLAGNDNMLSTPDALGKTVLSRAPRLELRSEQRSVVQRASQGARLSRPALAFFTTLGFLWLVANVTIAVGAILRLSREADITASESVLLPIAALAASLTPLIVWVRHLMREVWPSTPRSIEMGGRLRRTVLYSAAAYGLTALFVQLLESIVNRSGVGVARPGWALVAFQVGLLVAIVTWVMTRSKRA